MIHLGDVFIGKKEGWFEILPHLTGRKVLVVGNHDRHSCVWWMTQGGFDWACESMILRRAYLTHKPARELPPNADINIFGHLHNIWDGFHPDDPKVKPDSDENFISRQGRLWHPWQRLFAVEYTNYMPVEFDKFVHHADRYQARGPKGKHVQNNSGYSRVVDGADTGNFSPLPIDPEAGIPVSNAFDIGGPPNVWPSASDVNDGGADSTGVGLETDVE